MFALSDRWLALLRVSDIAALPVAAALQRWVDDTSAERRCTRAHHHNRRRQRVRTVSYLLRDHIAPLVALLPHIRRGISRMSRAWCSDECEGGWRYRQQLEYLFLEGIEFGLEDFEHLPVRVAKHVA